MKKFLLTLCLIAAAAPTFAGLYDDILPTPPTKQTNQQTKPAANTKQNAPKLTDTEIQMLGQEIIIQKLNDIELDLMKIKEKLGIYY